MNIETLKLIIAQGESSNLEFKKSTTQLKGAFETICAFLNNKGGKVLIGVTNEGRIVGQEVSDNTRQEIAREILKIEPSVYVDVEYVSIENNKCVIVLEVDAGCSMPYTYNHQPFRREQSTTSQMSQHWYNQLLAKQSHVNHSWEEGIAPGITIDDLDHDDIRYAVRQGVEANRIPSSALQDPIEDILRQFNLLKDKQTKSAAIVLFAKDVLPKYPQCLLKMARFQGTDRLGDYIDNQRVYGNVFKLMAEANQFLMRHFPIASLFDFNKFKRIDRPLLPVLAVREALVNALCHRDYSNRSAAVSLAIFDDRMEIWNNGTLPHELNLEDLKRNHYSFPRNQLIAEVFYKRGFIEGWGTGTLKMLELCRNENSPEPIFAQLSGGFLVQFPFREPIHSGMTKAPAMEEELSLRQKQILKILEKHRKLAVREILSLLENPPAARTLGDDLAQLKQYGLIYSEGIGRGAKWIIK